MIIEENALDFINKETEKNEKAKKRRRKEVKGDEIEEITHSEMQFPLARLGKSLGYKVWITRNDGRGKNLTNSQLKI